jgi:hypothetical protein
MKSIMNETRVVPIPKLGIGKLAVRFSLPSGGFPYWNSSCWNRIQSLTVILNYSLECWEGLSLLAFRGSFAQDKYTGLAPYSWNMECVEVV